ncbi:MAG: DUF2953 domain-containing protein [Eubacteriales bacterium]|nr:DUF2953 domain-containing protein [Eubacteriales bacterium]
MHKIKFPFSELDMEGLKGKKQVRWGKKKKEAKEEKKKLSAGEVLDRIKHIRTLFFSKGEELRSIAEYLQERLIVKKLAVTVYTGGNEACGIALKAGFAYSIIGILDSILSDKLNIKQKCILIQPNYSLKKTSIDLNCIMKLRFVNIIIAAIRFGYTYRKFEKEGSRCGNVTSN